MKFVIMLLVLFLRKLNINWPSWLANRSWQNLLMSYQQQFEQKSTVVSWLLLVFAPSLLVLLVFSGVSHWFWGLLGWAMAFILLMWMWGAESESNQIDALLAYGRLQDWEAFNQLVNQSELKNTNASAQQLDQRVLLAGAETLFASIFWLVVLGYWAFFFYLVNRAFCLHEHKAGEEEQSIAQAVHEVLMFPIARLLVVCIALVADYSTVMHQVKGKLLSAPNSELLLSASQGVNSNRSNLDEQQTLNHLEQMHGVLMRAMALWLVMGAVWILLVG